VTERSIAIFAQEADHPSARIASNRVMHAKDDDRSPARRNIYTIIGELAGLAATALMPFIGMSASRHKRSFHNRSFRESRDD